MKHLHDWSFDANGSPVHGHGPMATRTWRTRARAACKRLFRWLARPFPI